MGSSLSILDLIAAFPETDGARVLGEAIDELGTGATKNDGVLQPGEIESALREVERERKDERMLGTQPTQPPATGGSRLWSLMCNVLGSGVAERITSGSFANEVRTEKAAHGITEPELYRDLKVLCKDPVHRLREAGHPDYIESARWVARELAAAGVEPAGITVDGERTFLQPFRWQERFGAQPISKSYNVVGRIPGNGPAPREAVLVIAHLDNLSAGEKDWYERREGRSMRPYEGANDNTSSVVAVLEAVRALQDAGPSQRDVIVLIPSAEEDGLKGTEAFMMEPPEGVDLDRIIGAVNLEMVGRNDTEELLVFGGGTGRDAEVNPLYDRAMRVAHEHDIVAKPGHRFDDDEGWWRRSDHWVSHAAGIPSIMLHGRATPRSYHTSTDTLERLNMEKIRVSSQLTFRILRDLANAESPDERRGTPLPELNHFSGRVWPNVD